MARQVNSLVRYGTVPELLDLAAEGNRTCYASDDYNSGTLHTVRRTPCCMPCSSCASSCACLRHRLAALLPKEIVHPFVAAAAVAWCGSPSCAVGTALLMISQWLRPAMCFCLYN